jgi:2-C-methyl-D-erythritol 2,4-cyclodiphosphate synthase
MEAIVACVAVILLTWKFLARREMRIGHGWDLHRLEISSGGKPLILGGVEISRNFQVVAHSDGDVVLHALTDAILGAGGFPDIGEKFPDNDPQWAGAGSALFLASALEEISRSGWRLVAADVTVVLERPKLAGFKLEISKNLENLSGVKVNMKAKTCEGMDSVGRGEAVSAFAVVLLERRQFALL